MSPDAGGLADVTAPQERAQFVGFGVFEVDLESRELRRQGRRVHIPEQPFRVLSVLLERPGAVVTRDELRKRLWPGSVYVDFDHGLNNAIARLRETLGDDAISPKFIETLPRLGYRFIHPLSPAPTPVTTPPAAKSRWPARYGGLAVAAAAFAVLAVAWWRLSPGPEASAPEGASIAVLPFTSLSAAEEDEYFADGLSAELQNQLARIPGLRVIGRASSFQLRNRSQSTSAIAETLGVDHVLGGSVRRSDERIRVTAELIDARSGQQLWSETFERAFSDIFSIEDDIALAVATALRVRLFAADESALRRRGTRDPEAYRLYLMASARLRGLSVRQDIEGARQLFEQSISLDPSFAAAHAGLASYHNYVGAVVMRAPDEGARLGRTAAERAIALDPDGSEALRAMAEYEMWAFRFRGEADAYRRADALFRRAIEVDPSNASAYFDYARAIQWCEPERALRLFEKVIELDPLALAAVGLGALAMSRLGLHDAGRERLRLLEARSTQARHTAAVASFEAYLGHLDRAAEALARSTGPALLGPILQAWGIHMSIGDAATAAEILRRGGDDELIDALRTAALLGAEGRFADAHRHLESRRGRFPVSRVLDLPTARMALLAGNYEEARMLLEQRLQDFARGAEPVTAPHVLPALDLALAWSHTGRAAESERLLAKVAAFLDGPDAPRLPLFTVQRARAHALAGQPDLAAAALDRAYEEGFRMNCVLDLHPQPLLYVDCIDSDPAFAPLHRQGQFDAWLARVHAANRVQGQRLAHVAATDR